MVLPAVRRWEGRDLRFDPEGYTVVLPPVVGIDEDDEGRPVPEEEEEGVWLMAEGGDRVLAEPTWLPCGLKDKGAWLVECKL